MAGRSRDKKGSRLKSIFKEEGDFDSFAQDNTAEYTPLSEEFWAGSLKQSHQFSKDMIPLPDPPEPEFDQGAAWVEHTSPIEVPKDLVEDTSPIGLPPETGQSELDDSPGPTTDMFRLQEEREGSFFPEDPEDTGSSSTFFPEQTGEVEESAEGSSMLRLQRSAEELSQLILMNQPRPSPLITWFYSIPRPKRIRLTQWVWMGAASLLIVSSFTASTLLILPLLSDTLMPSFGPKPKSPWFFLPPHGELFALVENSPISKPRFKAGMECIWVSADPVKNPELDFPAPYLIDKEGNQLCQLETRTNWDGLLRFYFDEGQLPVDEPLMLVIPVRNGGLHAWKQGKTFQAFLPGGKSPSRVVLGPLKFIDEEL